MLRGLVTGSICLATCNGQGIYVRSPPLVDSINLPNFQLDFDPADPWSPRATARGVQVRITIPSTLSAVRLAFTGAGSSINIGLPNGGLVANLATPGYAPASGDSDARVINLEMDRVPMTATDQAGFAAFLREVTMASGEFRMRLAGYADTRARATSATSEFADQAVDVCLNYVGFDTSSTLLDHEDELRELFLDIIMRGGVLDVGRLDVVRMGLVEALVERNILRWRDRRIRKREGRACMKAGCVPPTPRTPRYGGASWYEYRREEEGEGGFGGLTDTRVLSIPTVLGGEASRGIELSIPLQITNPSNIILNTNTDAEFDLLYNNVNCGVVILPNVAVRPGVNALTARSFARGEGRECALMLERFTGGVDLEVVVAGGRARGVPALDLAFGALRLPQTLPSNKQRLINSAVLLAQFGFQGLTLTTQSRIVAANPFDSAVTITHIRGEIKRDGSTIGRIDQAVEGFFIPAKGSAESPLLTVGLVINVAAFRSLFGLFGGRVPVVVEAGLTVQNVDAELKL
ncbi:hypothetical protein HDU67_009495, partial [Dinochytrium kinnereticum]